MNPEIAIIDPYTMPEYHEAERLAVRIAYRERTVSPDIALTHALALAAIKKMDLRGRPSFEVCDLALEQVHPAEVRDLLRLRLNHPDVFWSSPEAVEVRNLMKAA